MTYKNQKTVILIEGIDVISGSLQKAIETLQDYLTRIPEEHWDSAEISLYFNDYEEVEVCVFYKRDYTEEESRLLPEHSAKLLESNRERDRKIFDRLKSEWGFE